MLLWSTDLLNVAEEVTIHRPNVSTLLSGAFFRRSVGGVNSAQTPFNCVGIKASSRSTAIRGH